MLSPRLACLVLALAPSLAPAEDWPQWRGPDRTDVSRETGLLKAWPAGGPKRLWLHDKGGKGYAGFAVVAGTLYTLGTRGDAEVVLALDAAKGDDKWTASIGPVLDNDWGDGPRGTPTVDGDRLYALGGQGNLICVETKDGKERWRVALQDLGGKTPGWGYTESVLVDGDKVICTPGGKKGAIAALDKASGKVVWQSKDFTEGAHYSSTIVAEPHGTRQYIQLVEKSVVGIGAADGKLLWRVDFPGRTAVIPTPIFADGHVYVTAGYGAGCKLLKLEPGNKITEVYASRVMKNHHGGVIKVGEHVYGYSDDAGWVCQDFLTGEQKWREKSKLGKGAVACADGKLYCLAEEDGTVVLLDASPEGWKENGRFQLDPQSKIRSRRGRIWTHPVIADGRLYLRDQDLISCHDVRGP